MRNFNDFTSAVQDWREQDAIAGRDPVGDRLAAREDARFLRETYSDGADYAVPAVPVKVERMQMSFNFEEVA